MFDYFLPLHVTISQSRSSVASPGQLMASLLSLMQDLTRFSFPGPHSASHLLYGDHLVQVPYTVKQSIPHQRPVCEILFSSHMLAGTQCEIVLLSFFLVMIRVVPHSESNLFKFSAKHFSRAQTKITNR